MGLFDSVNFDDPKTMGLLNAGFGMMAESGNPYRPQNLGAVLQTGLNQYQTTLTQADLLKRKQESDAMRLKMAQQDYDQQAGVMNDNQAARQNAQRWGGILQQAQESGQPLDLQKLRLQGVPFNVLKELADSKNLGRDEVTRTAEIQGADGGKVIQGYTKYGDAVGSGVSGYVAPQLVNQGNKSSFVTPQAGQSVPMGLSPSEAGAESRFNRQLEQSNKQFNERLEFDKNTQTNPVRSPMSVTLQKELLESDDVKQSSKAITAILGEAKKLNKQAYSGYGASTRAKIASNFGSSESADATVNLDNMMTGQALESLKTIFGGMPTEGERKILLDMQASADKTPKQREDIMDRAIAASDRRGLYASKKADAIRSGKYLTEGVADTAATMRYNVQTGKLEKVN